MVAVCCLGLTGCAADATSRVREFLASEREPDDALPPSVNSEGGIDADSSRLAGSLGGTTYYLADFVNPDTGVPGICLILVAADTEFSNSACGNAPGLATVGSETGGATIVEASDSVSADWTRLTDFLIVNPDARP